MCIRDSPFTVETTARVPIEAQMWFRCFGARPMTDYLDEDLAAARRPDGRLRVTELLNVVGQDRVFAIGDITDLPESKRASIAADHATVVAQNILSLIHISEPTRLGMISYAVFCLKKKKKKEK